MAVGHCVLQRLAGRPLSRLAHLGRRIGDPAERKASENPPSPGNTPHMRVDGAGAGKEMVSVCLSARDGGLVAHATAAPAAAASRKQQQYAGVTSAGGNKKAKTRLEASPGDN